MFRISRRFFAASPKIVLVESPNKVKSVRDYLEKELKEKVTVHATIGHFRETTDLELVGDYTLSFKNTTEKQDNTDKIHAVFKDIVSKNTQEQIEVILASDPDREGELIAQHAFEEFVQPLLKTSPNLTFSRAYFYAITPDKIAEGYHERQRSFLDKNLVNSALARHGLDILFGFAASALLRAEHSQCRSLGRVQTPALSLLCKREEEIQEFLKRGANVVYESGLVYHVDGEEVKATFVADEHKGETSKEETSLAHCKAMLEKLRDPKTTLKGIDVKKKTTESQPPVPLTMATLIQHCAQDLRMGGEAVGQAAQKLFSDGFITYPRTDSVRYSEEYEKVLKEYIVGKYGDDVYNATGAKKVKGGKGANAEGAHEAIHPTNMKASPEMVANKIFDPNARAVYSLIYQHSVSSRMIPSSSISLTGELRYSNDVKVSVQATKLTVLGWRRVGMTEQAAQAALNPGPVKLSCFNALEAKDGTKFVLQDVVSLKHVEAPPRRYNEGSLIKALKDAEIGRPSTYASILQTLHKRQYASSVDSQHRLGIGVNGFAANAFALRCFKSFVDLNFTSEMESSLEQVAAGTLTRLEVLDSFWKKLDSTIVAIPSIQIPYPIVGSNAYYGNVKSLQELSKHLDSSFGKKKYSTNNYKSAPPTGKKGYKGKK